MGPILGVAFSGCIFDRIGGYNGMYTPLLINFFMFISATCALLSVATVKVWFVSLMILVELFTGGLCVPVLTGYMLNTVPRNLQTEANSIAMLVYNVLGYFPAPSIYAIVYQANGSGTNRYGMLTV